MGAKHLSAMGLVMALAASLAGCSGSAPQGASDAVKASATVQPPEDIQVTGKAGSPAATTTIDGRQLPPPDAKFGGVIKDNAAQSKAWWAPRVVPPKGAPNVLLIMTDDVGFGAPGYCGSLMLWAM